ncbi:MAG: flagellar motor switch protein FliG [Bacteroidota bacterium]
MAATETALTELGEGLIDRADRWDSKEMSEAEVQEHLNQLKGSEKAGILLIALGMDAAVEILPHLPDNEVEAISVAIAKFRNVSSEIVEAVMIDYRDLAMGRDFISQGGVSFARTALQNALGPRRAEEIMMRVEAAMEVSAFHLLQTLETTQLTNFIQNEHPQTAALILAHLNEHKAAEILATLSKDSQSEILYRLATMGKTSPELMADVEEVIRQQIGSVIGSQLSNMGGIDKAVQILNKTSRTSERVIMDDIKDRDEGLYDRIKGLMFVFEDLTGVADRDMQRILIEVDQRDLVLSLKGASPELTSKLLSNISERARAVVEEELEIMGPTRVRDVEEAQRRVLDLVSDLEEKEEITLSRGGGDDFL